MTSAEVPTICSDDMKSLDALSWNAGLLEALHDAKTSVSEKKCGMLIS